MTTVYCGVDFHSRRQTVCYCDSADGEVKVKDLHYQTDNVRAFYAQFTDKKVIVGKQLN